MISRRAVIPAILAPALACRKRRGTGFTGYAFVANEEGQAIAAVDLTSFALARHIPLPARPTAVAAHPWRTSIYALTPQTGTVYEIDASNLALARRVQVARGAVSMRLSPDGNALWVLCSEPSQLVRIRVDLMQAGPRIALAPAPRDFDISRDGQFCAVSFGEDGGVTLFDLATRRAVASARIGGFAGVVRFRSDGKCCLAADSAERAISILEAPSARTIVRLPLAMRPENLCFSGDGGQLFVTGEGMDAVAIIYPFTTEVAGTFLAGRTPGAMAASAAVDQQYLFVANTQSGDVTIFDIDMQRVIASVAVGEEPACITVTPDSQYALVLNRRSGNMAVIRTAAVVPRRTRSAPLFTMIPVGSKPVSAAVRGV